MSNSKPYLQLFAEHRALVDQNSCAAMNAHRDEAAKILKQKGLPLRKDERYRYFDVQGAFAPDFGVNLQRALPSVNPYEVYRCNVPNLSTSLCFVVNDTPILPAHNHFEAEGIKVACLKENSEFIADFYNRAVHDADAVAALNTMLAQDGLLIYVPAHVKTKNPIQLVNVCYANHAMLSNRRLLVVVEEGAEAQILICDHVAGRQPYLTTQVAEVFAQENSKVELYTIEEGASNVTKFAHFYIQQQAGSQVTMNGVTLHAGQTHNQVNVRLMGEHAQVFTGGAVIAGGQEVVDDNIVVEHVAPNCNSKMLYKYVLDDHSVSAFAGKVLVQPDAQHTLSEQTNANLCVVPTAHAYAQPMLEIYADDVKCNHGSTVGKLDESALFYMRQRGISEQEARLLLQYAFVNEVLQHVEIEYLRERLAHLVEMRFRGEANTCDGCKICK
jgi:Fe-S cluster assembly protein SufD